MYNMLDKKVEIINGVEYPRMRWSEMISKYPNRRVFLTNMDNTTSETLVTVIAECSDEEYEKVFMSLSDIGSTIFPYRTNDDDTLLGSWI